LAQSSRTSSTDLLPRSDPPQATAAAFAVIAGLYLFSALTVRLAGPWHWDMAPRLLTCFQTRKVTPRMQSFVKLARVLLERQADDEALLELYRQNQIAAHRRGVFVAAFRRKRGWNPEIVLTGADRLERARGKGRGLIIWSDPFVHASIIGKRALAQAGYRAWHLSNIGHGILNSRLADRFINPKVIEVELRYLAGRIVFDHQTGGTATRGMMKVLEGNGVISLTNNAYIGKTVATPFGRGAVLHLAQTPLRLAALRGVPLLPLQVIEHERFRRYEAILGPDLSEGMRAGSGDPVEESAAAYAGYLLPLVRANPVQFSGWPMMRLTD
jgi:hypothetical protein